jgi:hypothetical protein
LFAASALKDAYFPEVVQVEAAEADDDARVHD